MLVMSGIDVGLFRVTKRFIRGDNAVTPLVPRVVLQAFFIAVLWWAGVRSNPTE